MGSHSNSAFEPAVIFPDDPYAAACMYFGVMAYPEPDAGLPGGSGSEFAHALQRYQLWATKRTMGQSFLRKTLRDPHFTAPRRREFEGALERGRRRIFRRMAAFDVVGTQLINGFFRVRALASQALSEGQPERAFHIVAGANFAPVHSDLWKQAMPSSQQLLRSDPEHWAKKFALNSTGKAADPRQKAKDLNRRAFETSIPVLHMAHGLNEAVRKVATSINGWGERDPILALQLNAELWLRDAVDAAERWRAISDFTPGIEYLRSDRMVELKRP